MLEPKSVGYLCIHVYIYIYVYMHNAFNALKVHEESRWAGGRRGSGGDGESGSGLVGAGGWGIVGVG